MYSWYSSLGLNYLALYAYYLGGIFTPLVYFFKNIDIPDVIYLITIVKLSFSALAFWYYSLKTHKINNAFRLILSVCYGLNSFSIAYSEMIMWLDALIYLPLVILGINYLLKNKIIWLLFSSYILLFTSNYYMGFIVGIFSFIYFILTVCFDYKKNVKYVGRYLVTAISSALCSMFIILPTFLDLYLNGEQTNSVYALKTDATGVWDLIIKNMNGVYDSTKYGSTPFIFVGILPVIFLVYYFINSKIQLNKKLLNGSLLLVIILSFYIEPLNLFWHGMHSPYMFLFRYSFLLSFTVVMIAGFGLEKLSDKDNSKILKIGILLVGLYSVFFITNGGDYPYVSDKSFLISLGAILIYTISIIHLKKLKIAITTLLILLVGIEMGLNTSAILSGISKEWVYPSRALYTRYHSDIEGLVATLNDKEMNNFYRLENLDPVSTNDAFNFGYSGVSMFSSVRNRNASTLLDSLGFFSSGTNLNIKYNNNTLLADALVGIKYNLSQQDIHKYGYTLEDTEGKYGVYKNNYSLPLGIITDTPTSEMTIPANDNINAQTALFNHLAGSENNYFSFMPVEASIVDNATVSVENGITTYTAIDEDKDIGIIFTTNISSHSQSYLSLFLPEQSEDITKSTIRVLTPDNYYYSLPLTTMGQYYNLGSYQEGKKLIFKVTLSDTLKISFVTPKLLSLNYDLFAEDAKIIQNKDANLKVNGSKVTTTTNLSKNSELFTTIPYDRGWRAFEDGKEIEVGSFEDGFITLPLSEGKHSIELVYSPYGLKSGAIISIIGFIIFILYFYNKKLTLVKKHTNKILHLQK